MVVATLAVVCLVAAALGVAAVVSSWLEAKDDENAEIECGARRDVEPGGRVVVRNAGGRRLCVYLDRQDRTVTQEPLSPG